MRFYGLNRYLCDVLDDMRKLIAPNVQLSDSGKEILKSLIEEAQIMGNRMESALHEQHDLETLNKEKKKLKKEVEALEAKKVDLGGTIEE